MNSLRRYIIILTLFLVFGFFFDHSVLSYSNKLTQASYQLEDELHQKNWTAASNTLSTIEENWTHKKKIWLLMLNHENMDEIDRYLKETKHMIDIQHYEIALYALSNLQHAFEDIPQSQKLSLSNIF